MLGVLEAGPATCKAVGSSLSSLQPCARLCWREKEGPLVSLSSVYKLEHRGEKLMGKGEMGTDYIFPSCRECLESGFRRNNKVWESPGIPDKMLGLTRKPPIV